MTFEEYLVTKRIDSEIFRQNEPSLWDEWKREFEQMHPGSFTAQKLYLINPIRRKYPGKTVPKETTPVSSKTNEAPVAKPVAVKPRPVFKPKPKTDTDS